MRAEFAPLTSHRLVVDAVRSVEENHGRVHEYLAR